MASPHPVESKWSNEEPPISSTDGDNVPAVEEQKETAPSDADGHKHGPDGIIVRYLLERSAEFRDLTAVRKRVSPKISASENKEISPLLLGRHVRTRADSLTHF